MTDRRRETAAATSFNFSVIVIPSSARATAANLDFPTLNQSLSFGLEISTPSDFQTLYSQDSKGGAAFKGLLYVPDLDPTDPCDNPQIVPRNVTRKANLPLNDLKLIAYAPLITPHCSRQYMYSAEGDNVAAFIFYGVPDRYSNMTDPLNDDDFPFEYPVYYLDGAIGQPLMNKLAEYSTNISEVYDGFNLTEAGYDLRDYARIYAVISTKNTNPMPGLWLFLLVVVAVLLFIIGASSLLMHLFQFHYRRSLRRRIANGEVDLEGLGVGRITVPREFMAKFPVYVYIADPSPQDPQAPPPAVVSPSKEGRTSPSKEGKASPSKPVEPTTTTEVSSNQNETNEKAGPSARPISPPLPPDPTAPTAPVIATTAVTVPSTHILAPTTTVPAVTHTHMARGYHQTTCPICLEDFIHQETTVRELPCLHIFHPECIDPYLESQSSLCVLCKQSCLPKGYVPIRLTNAIVRRERLLRRVRERSREAMANGGSADDGGMMWRWRVRRLRRHEEDLMGRQALTRASMRASGGQYDYRRYGAGQSSNGAHGSGHHHHRHQREPVEEDSGVRR
ncbi:hypothetical protein H072_9380 [Dactylellina haptotyla CBS 200.50]|uniref:RING-type domain-containing protein n=1 Tax=Dactylellina haptotyla (strain CBS 200.50) TaxID=1284197 RepID=S8A2S2_DACHA|nr:hypothetical protein H072_9380 [Dactylellina haptotyla CBS 200.50]